MCGCVCVSMCGYVWGAPGSVKVRQERPRPPGAASLNAQERRVARSAPKRLGEPKRSISLSMSKGLSFYIETNKNHKEEIWMDFGGIRKVWEVQPRRAPGSIPEHPGAPRSPRAPRSAHERPGMLKRATSFKMIESWSFYFENDTKLKGESIKDHKGKPAWIFLESAWLRIFFKQNAAITNGFTINPNRMLLKLTILQHLQK